MEQNVLVNTLIKDRTITKKGIFLCFKRLFDILISIIGMVFLIPILLITKIVYMISGDFKSIIFKQNRIGLNGKEFKFYKIRTMIPNADEELERLMKEDKKIAEEYKKYKKLHNDPRITKGGSFLRRMSIDEFPQFINIFKGDMSVIGPRPYLPREKEDMGKSFDKIVTCKPGLTGYWQVSGRSNTDFEERLELDKIYVDKQSLKIDVKIFFKTFLKILGREGAK